MTDQTKFSARGRWFTDEELEKTVHLSHEAELEPGLRVRWNFDDGKLLATWIPAQPKRGYAKAMVMNRYIEERDKFILEVANATGSPMTVLGGKDGLECLTIFLPQKRPKPADLDSAESATGGSETT